MKGAKSALGRSPVSRLARHLFGNDGINIRIEPTLFNMPGGAFLSAAVWLLKTARVAAEQDSTGVVISQKVVEGAEIVCRQLTVEGVANAGQEGVRVAPSIRRRRAHPADTTLDQLVESADDQDVVIRPQPCHTQGMTSWLLSRERSLHGVTVAKMRITADRPTGPENLKVHPGHEWFTVLSGTARLQLGERTIVVQTGDAAEFSTMPPHAIGAHDGPVEILTILDHNGERTHLHNTDDASMGRLGK